MQQQGKVNLDEANIYPPALFQYTRVKKKHALLAGDIGWLLSLLPTYKRVAHIKQKGPLSKVMCFRPSAWDNPEHCLQNYFKDGWKVFTHNFICQHTQAPMSGAT